MCIGFPTCDLTCPTPYQLVARLPLIFIAKCSYRTKVHHKCFVLRAPELVPLSLSLSLGFTEYVHKVMIVSGNGTHVTLVLEVVVE